MYGRKRNSLLLTVFSPLSGISVSSLKSGSRFLGPSCLVSGALFSTVAETPCHHEPVLMGRRLVWCRGILGFLIHLCSFLFFFFFPEEVQKEEWAAVAKSYGHLSLNSPERCHSVYLKACRRAALRGEAVRTP